MIQYGIYDQITNELLVKYDPTNPGKWMWVCAMPESPLSIFNEAFLFNSKKDAGVAKKVVSAQFKGKGYKQIFLVVPVTRKIVYMIR